jgi:hypothetical protein
MRRSHNRSNAAKRDVHEDDEGRVNSELPVGEQRLDHLPA